MGRRSHTSILDVYMNGVLVGYWSQSPVGDAFQYAEDWLHDDRVRPISLSLPILPGNRPHTKGVEDYFDNLLTDSKPIRTRLAERYGRDPNNAFDLLTALGRDCVGALQFMPHDETPQDVHTIQYKAMTDAEVARHLRDIPTGKGFAFDEDDEELRLSIAGAQEKTALLWYQGQWCWPHGSTPTTHIMKLPLGLIGNQQRFDMRGSVENEWLCSKLLEAMGFPVANSSILTFEDQKVLVVERFDRALSEDESWIMRLPQEDMCQALGVPSHMKYQAHGGPGIQKIVDLLRRSENTEQDILVFYLAQVFFWLIAGTDGHAKNFSIQLYEQGRYSLTPLYDVLSAHPLISSTGLQYNKATLAMCVRGKNNHYHLREIQYRHWVEYAKTLGIQNIMEQGIDYLLEQIDDAISAVRLQLSDDFPEQIAESIFRGMINQREILVRQKSLI